MLVVRCSSVVVIVPKEPVVVVRVDSGEVLVPVRDADVVKSTIVV